MVTRDKMKMPTGMYSPMSFQVRTFRVGFEATCTQIKCRLILYYTV